MSDSTKASHVKDKLSRPKSPSIMFQWIRLVGGLTQKGWDSENHIFLKLFITIIKTFQSNSPTNPNSNLCNINKKISIYCKLKNDMVISYYLIIKTFLFCELN